MSKLNKFEYETYIKMLSEIDKQPKNIAYEELSKAEYIELLRVNPHAIFSNVYEDTKMLNGYKMVKLNICKDLFTVKEVMELREQCMRHIEINKSDPSLCPIVHPKNKYIKP